MTSQLTAFQLELLDQVPVRPEVFGMPALLLPIPERIDEKALTTRLRPLVERSPILRTEVVGRLGEWARRTAELPTFEVRRAPISNDGLADRVSEAAGAVFDDTRLDRAPLLGFTAFDLDTSHPTLMVAGHHLLMDNDGLALLGQMFFDALWGREMAPVRDDALGALASAERRAVEEGVFDASIEHYARLARRATPKLAWDPRSTEAVVSEDPRFEMTLAPWCGELRVDEGPARELLSRARRVDAWAEEAILAMVVSALGRHLETEDLLVDVVRAGRGPRFGLRLIDMLGPTSYVMPVLVPHIHREIESVVSAAQSAIHNVPDQGIGFLPLLHHGRTMEGLRTCRARVLFTFSGRSKLDRPLVAPDGSARAGAYFEDVPWWDEANGDVYELNVQAELRHRGIVIRLVAGSDSAEACLPGLMGSLLDVIRTTTGALQ